MFRTVSTAPMPSTPTNASAAPMPASFQSNPFPPEVAVEVGWRSRPDSFSLTSGVDYGVQGKNIWRLADLGAKQMKTVDAEMVHQQAEILDQPVKRPGIFARHRRRLAKLILCDTRAVADSVFRPKS